MNFFGEATLRLKQQLQTTQDKEVASTLGLSPQSWAGRKNRGNFPEKELYALAAKRPDLGIDVDWILGGGAVGPMSAAPAQRAGGDGVLRQYADRIQRHVATIDYAAQAIKDLAESVQAVVDARTGAVLASQDTGAAA